MRLLVVAVVAGLLAAPGAVAAPTLEYACSPAPADCTGWYRDSVRLSWDWDGLGASPSAGVCSQRTFTLEGRTSTFCEIQDLMGFTTRHTVVIRIDRTPPSVSGTPARPPDHNGWFNHPVSISFVGSDTTSGVAGCDVVSYAGPEGEGVAAPGSCTDVAGNVGTGAFSLNYDATRPRAPEVHAIPGRKRVRLEWSGPEDAPTVEVTRIAPRRKLVYRGTASRAVDRRLRNGVRYRYRVTAIDRAGNRASATARATPTTSALLLPARGGRLSSPPLLAWKKVKAARYYNVQLFRGTRKVVTEFPRSNRLQLRRSWRFEGGRRRLVPGNYTWYVWAVVSEADARLLGSRSFTVTR